MNRPTNGGAPLRVPTLHALLNTPFPPRDHLLCPWLRQGESAMVWAPTGVGKTMFCLSLALAVAGGGEFLGWTVEKPHRVLIVDGEMNMADLVDRCRLLANTIDGIDQATAAENITVMARQYQDPDAPFPDLAEEAGRQEVLDRARRGRFDLVILDNFSTLATVDDENAAAALSPVVGFLQRMKQAGIACVLVHHANKGGNDFRGSSKLATTFEVILGLHKVDGALARQGTAFVTSWDKYRGLRNETLRARKVCLMDGGGTAPRWYHELSEDEECQDLISELRGCQYATQEELAKAMSWSTGKLSKVKAKAIHSARLISEREWNDCMAAARSIRAHEAGHWEEPADNPDF